MFIYASHPRCEWLEIVLGMVGLVGSQIWWTWEVEDGFRQVTGGNKHAMKTLESKLTGVWFSLVSCMFCGESIGVNQEPCPRLGLDETYRYDVNYRPYNTIQYCTVHSSNKHEYETGFSLYYISNPYNRSTN